MFKLQSYIGPILLSYVDKYIKNFRLEDSQLSLWGGDASFQNLDLRLEVLEQELQSPFSFISGHIRELLIHVPWTKLTSEPITITINTIECVLKLKDSNDGVASDSSPIKDKRKSTAHKQEGEAPPNYVQLLINKIVSNIRIFCNNLILKYVEEDIVLSMNVKHLKVESCNEKWEAAYIDISPTQVIMRKVISVNDLTVCLDKRSASGKIDVYQEPMLYRCSMTMHLFRTYNSATANKTSLTRLDVYCNNMEFSMTEQQVPMFIRLIHLMDALQQKQFRNLNESQDNAGSTSEAKDSTSDSETWTGWAWSYVSSVIPSQWDEDLENQQLLNQSGHILQVGFYVDFSSLTFKLSDTVNDKGYYSQKKIRYHPLITLKLQGIYLEMVSVGRKWSNMQFGISEVLLLPIGNCSCAYLETADGTMPYLTIGSKTFSHKINSLFDIETAQNSEYRNYNTNWEFHMFTNTEASLLERTPAVACDYVYQMEPPDDATSDILSDLGSNLEYSNMAEKGSMRICFGPFKFRVCSGLMHRLSSLQVAASSYDYSPYYVPKSDPLLHELLPPSEEDFDALIEFIPSRTMRIMIFEPVIEIQYMDHPYFQPSKGSLFRKPKKHSTTKPPSLQLQKLPKITVECQLIELKMENPMYVNRLVHTTCQLPEPPKEMFEACFSKQNINIVGLCSRLILKPNNHTTLVVPFNLSIEFKSIIKPQYWINPDVVHNEIIFQSENLTFTCTKAKLIVVSYLIDAALKRNTDGLKNLRYTSLLYDASRDHAMPYLELYVEGVRFKKVATNSTVSLDLALESIKAFVFESVGDNLNDRKSKSAANIQQVLFLSGPEPRSPQKKSNNSFSEELLTATLQYSLKPDSQAHPSLLIFNLQEIKVCVDPLVCKWLLYHPIDIGVHKPEGRSVFAKSKSFSETHASASETPRRSSAQIESVHSSSDRDLLQTAHQKLPVIEEEEPVDLQEQIYEFLKTWHPVWKNMLLSGHLSQCIIYFPMSSISAVGSRGIEEAVKEALKKKLVPNVMVITLPFANIHSAQKQNIVKFLKNLPVKLPETIWSVDHSSFPWTISISDLNCYSMERGKEISFLKTVGLSATVGLSTKCPSDTKLPNFENPSIGCLGLYVHIDVTPIIISVSETQMYLLASLIYGLGEFFSSLTPRKTIDIPKQSQTEVLPSIMTANSPSLSPTAKDNTLDDTSETINEITIKNDEENVKLTAWIQWTFTKFSIELLAHQPDSKGEIKLMIDMEDMVSSLDYQSVYLKLKSKVGSISVQHFKRSSEKSKWQPGAFSGVVMKLRDDVSIEKRPEDSGFIGITVTRASSRHTHNLWGTVQKPSKEKKISQVASTSRYITEIVVIVQPIDFVISFKTLIGFYSIIAPFVEGISEAEMMTPKPQNESFSFTNQALPLAYLECNEIRVIIPSLEVLGNPIIRHDVYVLQVGKISLSPSVINPICRTPLRPDIYRQAAQARVLTIPGSELEDRQYQLDLVGVAVNTTTWKDLEQILNIRGNIMRGVNENPALEWNNLEQGKLSLMPTLNHKQVAEKFDISIVTAPTMVYKNDIVICSSSIEINFVSDIAFYLSLDQLKLASTLMNELTIPADLHKERKIPEITYPYSRFDNSVGDLETELTEFYKDSGIDMSEIRSVLSGKSFIQAESVSKVKPKPHPTVDQPFEILFTAGKITCCLYQMYITQSLKSRHRGKKKKFVVEDEDSNYEASEEESVDEGMKSHKKFIPLIFFSLWQPNVYSSSQQFLKTTHLSVFDLNIKLSDSKSHPISAVPSEQNFTIDLLKTRSGNPDVVTGIPPAFFTLKYTKEYGKMATLHVDVARPTKIAFSTTKILTLLSLKNKLIESFPLKESKEFVVSEPQSTFRVVKNYLHGIEVLQFKTDQLIFSLESENNLELNFVISKLKNRLYSYDWPEKIQNFTAFEAVMLSVSNDKVNRLILNPWTVTVEVNALIESWQSDDGDPQVHISVDSDCVMLDVNPQQVVCLEKISKEISDFLSSLPSNDETFESLIVTESSPQQDRDQHYKDDLRAGAFQFIEAANDEDFPLPYQVMFWNNNMTWRYPQPRSLTKVRIFPVPFENLPNLENIKISCDLQYWCDNHCSFICYSKFNLSESDVCYLKLPDVEPQQAVAYMWRVVLTTTESGEKIETNYISSRALAACMRIDSYFNKTIVPNLTMALFVSKLEVSLFTNFDKDTSIILPLSLKRFQSDLAVPQTHCFFKSTIENLRSYLSSWNFRMLHFDMTSVIKCSILDYAFLTQQTLIEQFSSKIEINMADKLSCNFACNQIQLKLGPNTAHTLTASAQLWSQNIESYHKEDNEFIIFTRYVICNDTNVTLRIAQISTDEDIILPSRCFHLYSWRSLKYKRKLIVAFEDKGWVWSSPFRIDQEGTQTIQFASANHLTVIVTVKQLSATQKQIIFGGHFIIANMLLEHFEFKIVAASKEDKEREMRKAPVHVLGGKTITPSMFIHSNATYFLRLRFFGLEAAWSGDIPLKAHTKGAQPWLVKVPLQERGQFLSIWCRIIEQDSQKSKRILAMLWPLFMVKSNLPVSSKIHIETPTLNVHLDSIVSGKGELQQLYCPGTIDHSHQLSFKLHNGTSISDPYIPLNYSLVDQEKFFRKSEKEDINEILDNLRGFDDSKWPYLGEDLENIDWIVDEQPQTIIQVRYQNACQYSSALLVELLPWCLMVNVFGCPISLMVNGTELCRIPQYGIVAPPKLDDNFHLGIDTVNGWAYSGPLQLATSDWSQTFYMPIISGTLPAEGNIKTPVKSGADVCMTSICSTVTNEIRLLKVSSTHVFSNYLNYQIQVACLAVPDSDKLFTLPSDTEKIAFSVAAQTKTSDLGISIIRWHCLDAENCDLNTNYAFYITFSLQYDCGWSCPVRVDEKITRRSISLMGPGEKSIPLVLTAQERKGQTYLSLHHDDCPQTLIKNKSLTPMYCAQADNNNVVVESSHFFWFHKIDVGYSTYYTMPFVSEKFPELPQTSFSERIVFAVEPKDEEEFQWSSPVSITHDLEQFVRIPGYGDIKLIVKVTTYSTLVTIESLSQIEISAIDIRGRLSQHEIEIASGKSFQETAEFEASATKTSIESPSSNTGVVLDLSKISLYQSMFVPTLPLNEEWKSVQVFGFVKSLSILFLTDQETEIEKQGVISFTFDNIGVEMIQTECLNLLINMSDIQIDNQLYSRNSYDFPVILISQENKTKQLSNIFEITTQELIESVRENPLFSLKLNVETWKDTLRDQRATGVKEVKIKLDPFSIYIEDLYVNRLLEYFTLFVPTKLISTLRAETKKFRSKSVNVKIPETIYYESAFTAKPLNLKNITIEPLSLLLSVHCSVKMYIALDQSPLQFGKFERKRLLTTPYRLGHAMTMHYLSGAIFGAGWVVSSLELLGSPSGLARAMGTGLRDFINMPYRGLVEGPWAFLTGVTSGAASLMKHITAGTLQSVTKLASSVARNLDRLTLDEEHLKRTEEQRRQKPQGVAQGFILGLTGLGISLLGAVAGIAHHPLQSIMADGASPRSLAAGVGLGLVGVITKPLSGAAELVALTGQGLLQGAGWNPLPEPRIDQVNSPDYCDINSTVKYEWKFLRSVTYHNVLDVIEATIINNSQFSAVALILSSDALIIVDLDEDVIKRIISLSQLQIVSNNCNDPTLLSLKIITKVEECNNVVEMDPASRARVADYVKSTATLLQLPSEMEQEHSEGSSLDDGSEQLSCYVNPQNRNFFIALVTVAKQNVSNFNFPVL